MVLWKVVGGVDKGGILVRTGKDLTSAQVPQRLQTGSLIQEITLVGDRLFYALFDGGGPAEGWVSLKVSDKVLVTRHEASKPAGADSAAEGDTASNKQSASSETITKDSITLDASISASIADAYNLMVAGDDSIDGITIGTLAANGKADGPARERQFQQRIATRAKVKLRNLPDGIGLNGKNGQILGFDPETGRYAIKVIILTDRNIGMKKGWTIVMLETAYLEIHRDQLEKDKVLNGDEIVLLGAGDAKRKLYEVQMDPQYWYDKAIERVFNAKNDFEVLDIDIPTVPIEDVSLLKRQYRKISLAVHPDKNNHPQAGDAFRKVYGAFETLMDVKQQRRLLWIMGKLDKDLDEKIDLEDDEEDELFQWWWEASVPEIEKQAAEFEGQQFDELGAMWISDGLGGNVEDVKWMGLETAKRLHAEDAAIFIDCRDYPEFIEEHIIGAWCTPLPNIIDYGLVNVFPAELIARILRNRKLPIVIYSEVATPFSRCRALCRWLLRAGHVTLKAERLRRLRGGIFGWRHRHGLLVRPLEDEKLEIQDMPINISKAQELYRKQGQVEFEWSGSRALADD